MIGRIVHWRNGRKSIKSDAGGGGTTGGQGKVWPECEMPISPRFERLAPAGGVALEACGASLAEEGHSGWA